MIEAKTISLLAHVDCLTPDRWIGGTHIKYSIDINSLGIVISTSRRPESTLLNEDNKIVVLFEGTKQCVIPEHWCELVM